MKQPTYKRPCNGRTEVVEKGEGYFVAEVFRNENDKVPSHRVQVNSISKLFEKVRSQKI